jgi:hypothetical protein
MAVVSPTATDPRFAAQRKTSCGLGLVALVGLLEMDRLWYITVGKTHPRVFLSEDAFLAGDSWPPEVLTKGDGESADF